MRRFLPPAVMLVLFFLPAGGASRNTSPAVLVDPAGSGVVERLMITRAGGDDKVQMVRLTARAGPGYVFDHWGGDTGDTDNPRDIDIGEPANITAHFVPAVKGLVIGADSHDPITGVTVSFDDGGSAVTDGNGYWIRKYPSNEPPGGSVTVALTGDGFAWESHAPASATVSWPAEDVVFCLEGYRFCAAWGSFGGGEGLFGLACGVAVDSTGRFVYVSDPGNNCIQKFDADGSYITQWGTYGGGEGQFDYPGGVAVDTAGCVYVADKSNHRIQKFDACGRFLAEWGIPASGDSRFYNPSGVAAAGEGSFYVADTYNNRIQRFDQGGCYARWGSAGSDDGQLIHPYGVAVDTAWNFVYVADTGNARIQKFDAEGNFLAKWGSPGDGRFDHPMGVAVDAAGNVYVADNGNHRIQKFDSRGNSLAKWGTFGVGDGQFNFPGGVAVDAVGNVYVADTYNYRIQKFEWVD